MIYVDCGDTKHKLSGKSCIQMTKSLSKGFTSYVVVGGGNTLFCDSQWITKNMCAKQMIWLLQIKITAPFKIWL